MRDTGECDRSPENYQHAVVQTQFREHFFLYLAQLRQKTLTLVLGADNEHLNLAELMDSVQPFAGHACTQHPCIQFAIV